MWVPFFNGTSQIAFISRRVTRTTIAKILDWWDFCSQPSLISKSRRAERSLRLNSENIAEAERQVALQQLNRISSARKNAAAVRKALDAANTEAKVAQTQRDREVDNQTAQTQAQIDALQRSIARARVRGEERLGELSVKHASARAAEENLALTADQTLRRLSLFTDETDDTEAND